MLLDNASTYPPLLDYYSSSPHEVRYLGHNYGCRSIWDLDIIPRENFVFTDPDVVPIAECPYDLVHHLFKLFDHYPGYAKVGVGLYLDDLPVGHLSYDWEHDLVSAKREIVPGVYDSIVDTTFAVYPPSSKRFDYCAIRTGYPYQARHLPWYRSLPLDEEHSYYLSHAIKGGMGTTWEPDRTH